MLHVLFEIHFTLLVYVHLGARFELAANISSPILFVSSSENSNVFSIASNLQFTA